MKFPTYKALLPLAIMLGSAGISTFDSAFALSKMETSFIKSNNILISQRNNDDRKDNKDNRENKKDNRPTGNEDRNNRSNVPNRSNVDVNVIRPIVPNRSNANVNPLNVNVIRPSDRNRRNVDVNVNRSNDWNRRNVDVNVNRSNDWNRRNVDVNVYRSNDWNRRNVDVNVYRSNDWNRRNVDVNVYRSNDWNRRNVDVNVYRSNDWNRRNVIIRQNNWSRPTIINNNNYGNVFNRDRGWDGGGWNGRGYYTPPGWNFANFVSGLIIGAVLTSPPPYYNNVYVSGTTYIYSDGVFLRPINNRYTVVAPPIGAVVSSLPFGCTPDTTNFDYVTQYDCSGVIYEPFYDGNDQAYRVIGY